MRNCGWLGSFHTDQVSTWAPKRRPAAVAKRWNSRGSGRLIPALSFVVVAHRGAGPVSVNCTRMPRAEAAASRRSYAPQPAP